MIQKNGFFELNPANAIQGARGYFNTAPFFDIDRQSRNIKESIASICTVLQVDETTSTLLINTCLQEKSFLKIEVFLKDYTVSKANSVALSDLESLKEALPLSQEKKNQLIEEIRNQLEEALPFNAISTWDDFTGSSLVNTPVYYYYIDLLKKQEEIIKKSFITLNKLVESISKFAFKPAADSILFYPPIEVIEKKLQQLPKEKFDILYFAFFPKTTQFSEKLIKLSQLLTNLRAI